MGGCGPHRADGTAITGKLGKTLTTEQGYEAARLVGMNMLGSIRAELRSLDKVKRVVKVLGMVNADPEFTETPKVINGFSDLFVQVFGDAGRGGSVGGWHGDASISDRRRDRDGARGLEG